MKKPAKEPSRGQASLWTQLLIPIAALIRGDLLALVHQLGMQAVAAMLEAERTKLCGARYKHDASRRATRAGSTRGELALGGRRVALRRPRVSRPPTKRWRPLPPRGAAHMSGSDAHARPRRGNRSSGLPCGPKVRNNLRIPLHRDVRRV
ncbi:MAG TPA: hypothetical protein VM580_05390 [Labilithrix sp.]|nr:hypothetical protein [Labilithrix sp.]